MKCMKCGATAQKGFTTNVTDLQDCLIIVRNVPCFKCLECNEIIYTGDVIQQLEEIIDSAKKLCRKFLLLIIQKLLRRRRFTPCHYQKNTFTHQKTTGTFQKDSVRN
ncbi:type II toxin-antitoxin system MqsA family antitoxin [Lachnospiraceae bacterium 56-18]